MSGEVIITFANQEQVELVADAVKTAFDNVDNDDDANELSEAHVALGFAPLVDEGDSDDC